MDYPHQTENRVVVPLNVHYRLDVSPDMILANEGLKNYPLKTRNCFLDKTEWNHMKIFKVKVRFLHSAYISDSRFLQEFSLSNCILECTAQISSDQCSCTQFYVPSKKK